MHGLNYIFQGGLFHKDVSIEGTQIFFASRRHGRALPWATATVLGYCPSKERPQKLQPFSSSVFLEHGRTRWPRASQAVAYVL